MPVCLSTAPTAQGQVLILQNPPPADMTACEAGVMLAPTEYGSWVMPSSADLAPAFAAGFLIPMSGYLIAYLVGRVVAIWNDDR